MSSFSADPTPITLAEVPLDLIPLDLTYVVYQKQSQVSLFFALITFLPFVIFISLVTLVLFRREIEALYQIAGLLLSTLLNFLLKQVIREPRPFGSVKSGYGMPSDHSQFMFFFSIYAIIWIQIRPCISNRSRHLLCVSLFFSSLLVAYSRCHLGVHSSSQVLCGGLVGSFCGVIWVILGRVFMWEGGGYDRILKWKISEWMRLRDMSGVPDTGYVEWKLWKEYSRWLEEEKRRREKTRGSGMVNNEINTQSPSSSSSSAADSIPLVQWQELLSSHPHHFGREAIRSLLSNSKGKST